MSLTPEAEEALAYLAKLKTEQEKVLLGGGFNRISEYKAACAVIRNLDRQASQIRAIFERKRPNDEGDGDSLEPMPESGS